MARTQKARLRTDELVLVSPSDENQTGYRLSVHFKKPNIRERDQILLEAPYILGEERVWFDVTADGPQLNLRTGAFCPLTPEQLILACGLLIKHKDELLTALDS